MSMFETFDIICLICLFIFVFIVIEKFIERKYKSHINNDIVYFGWGSLIFSPENITVEKWKRSGLSLPLEYSRISDKGKGRLTLVIDENNGTENYIWYTNSTETNINKAINELRVREKTAKRFIGYINRKNGKMRVGNLSDNLIEKIILWMEYMNINVVIWTNLESNFTDITGQKYSLDNAMKYYTSCNETTQLNIMNYIERCENLCSINTNFSDYL